MMLYKKDAIKDFTDALSINSEKIPLFELYIERGKVYRFLGQLD